MMSSKLKNIWLLLTTNDFKDIPEEYNCVICKNVSIEPFNALCKCRFCSKCIKEYLKDEKKYCPGKKPNCCTRYLDLEINVSKDIEAIQNILKLEVKCPNEMCEERCELENMNDHLRLCEKGTMKCSYESIGCEKEQMSGNNLRLHFDDEWFTHSQLLVEAINNLRNDFKALKVNSDKKDEQIHKLNEDSKSNEIVINAILQRVEDQNRLINELKAKDKERDSEMELMKETQKKTMMEELEKAKKDIIEKDVREHINIQNKNLNNLKMNQEKIETEIISLITNVRDSRIYDEREFIWRVNNFCKMKDDESQCMKTAIFRYSLQFDLSLWCGEDKLRFKCRIVKGKFDEYLKWPMKHKITLSLLNQVTMEVHKSIEYDYNAYENKYAFERPTNICNLFSFGDFAFMTVKDITDTAGLLLNDSIIVKFHIDYNK